MEDIECLLDPPPVPFHPEYALIPQGAPGQPKYFLQHTFLVIDILYRILRDIGLDDGQVFVDYYNWSNDRCIKIE